MFVLCGMLGGKDGAAVFACFGISALVLTTSVSARKISVLMAIQQEWVQLPDGGVQGYGRDGQGVGKANLSAYGPKRRVADTPVVPSLAGLPRFAVSDGSVTDPLSFR